MAWNDFVQSWGQFNHSLNGTFGVVADGINSFNKIEPITTRHEITTDNKTKGIFLLGFGVIILLIFKVFKK